MRRSFVAVWPCSLLEQPLEQHSAKITADYFRLHVDYCRTRLVLIV